MYADNIGFVVVCFQIISPKNGIVPISYRYWFFSCGHQFSLIVLNVANQKMSYQINQLYLVVLGGQHRMKAELMLSTSIIV